MKAQSNKPLPASPIKWKEESVAVFINHKHEGKSSDGDDIYTADFTVSKSSDIEGVITAFNRQINDPSLDEAVVHNTEVNGTKAIDIVIQPGLKVSSSVFPPLPSTGLIPKGAVYSYNNGAVMSLQEHARTIYPPEDTPALFSFYRDNIQDLPWIANERVESGWTRVHNKISYECIQGHMTLQEWTPDITPSLWRPASVDTEDPQAWVQPTGGHDAYNTGAMVLFSGGIYESLIDGNVWSPTVYPAGWNLIE